MIPFTYIHFATVQPPDSPCVASGYPVFPLVHLKVPQAYLEHMQDFTTLTQASQSILKDVMHYHLIKERTVATCGDCCFVVRKTL